MRPFIVLGPVLAAALLAGCVGNKSSTSTSTGGTPPPPVMNTMAVSVDTGPAADPGQTNHAYVTIKVCASGSTTQCATIDHVLLDTGSWGLRLVGSVLTAAKVTLSTETDAKGQVIEECVKFGGGDTWGPVALADITMAGETAAKLPVQVLDDANTAAPPPATCGANGTLLNAVTGFNANGLLGVGVFAQDCGAACVSPSTPLPIYYGCTSAGVCTAENVALASQVTNPVALFAADNNGVIVNMPNLVNVNGDASVQGELIFGLATQTDNALPATGLTVLGANSGGDFTATYNGGTTALPAMIDSGTDDYAFDDPSIPVCSSGRFSGLYCPAAPPQNLFAVNTGVGVNNATNTVDFALADPNTFVPTASAFGELGGGRGSTNFLWGMPFFYGRKVYIGIDQKASGSFTGPYYAY
ncbi:MAG: DUF3443 family protein [Steroidobacteraceae bacterium]